MRDTGITVRDTGYGEAAAAGVEHAPDVDWDET